MALGRYRIVGYLDPQGMCFHVYLHRELNLFVYLQLNVK